MGIRFSLLIDGRSLQCIASHMPWAGGSLYPHLSWVVEEKITAREEKIRSVASDCLPNRMHYLSRRVPARYHPLLFAGSPV
jgi:hypothetical protein